MKMLNRDLDKELLSGNKDYSFLAKKFNVDKRYIYSRSYILKKNEKKAPIVLREINNSINVNGITIESPNREIWIKREKDGYTVRW